MRKRPINSTNMGRVSIKIDPMTKRDAEIIADRLNEADKPEGFPTTWNGKPKFVTMAAAMAACTAIVRDGLDSGAITTDDLLERLAEMRGESL